MNTAVNRKRKTLIDRILLLKKLSGIAGRCWYKST
jgi:hypothetical protein